MSQISLPPPNYVFSKEWFGKCVKKNRGDVCYGVRCSFWIASVYSGGDQYLDFPCTMLPRFSWVWNVSSKITLSVISVLGLMLLRSITFLSYPVSPLSPPTHLHQSTLAMHIYRDKFEHMYPSSLHWFRPAKAAFLDCFSHSFWLGVCWQRMVATCPTRMFWWRYSVWNWEMQWFIPQRLYRVSKLDTQKASLKYIKCAQWLLKPF